MIINKNVLVLNQSYEPIMITSSRRAIILLLNEKVDELEYYNDFIRSKFISLRLPSVIRLKKYAKVHRNEIVLSRKNILKRDNYTCQYCGKSKKKMTIDHIVPKNKGGLNTWYNLVAACVCCNSIKGSKDLKETNMSLVAKPRKPSMILYLQRHVKSKQGSWRPYLFMKKDRDLNE